MSHPDHRPLRTVLTPWVIAMVTLIGFSALIPDHARARKFESSGELELSQLADDTAMPGRATSSPVFLTSCRQAVTTVLCASSQLILIDKRRGQSMFRAKDGAIRGRAPPAWRIA